jgi:hypothetical protein
MMVHVNLSNWGSRKVRPACNSGAPAREKNEGLPEIHEEVVSGTKDGMEDSSQGPKKQEI